MSNLSITNEDCMDLMKRYHDKYFELAIVDPPYGIGINHNMGRRKGDKKSEYKKVGWDNEVPKEDFFKELSRVSKNQIIWGGNYMTQFLAPSPCWIMWDKGFSEELTFAQFELAWTSFKTSCKKFDKNPSQQNRIHPTQKPVELYKWLLKNYAKEGDKILDTHLGSGSIAIACHYMGYNLTACELDKEYYDNAMERITNMTRQETLL
jgi:site-specific DNA-methyltransferase (adenine-specific)